MRICLAAIASLTVTVSAAQAADPAIVDVLPAPIAERFGWTGAYVGLSAGYGWLKDVDYAPPPPFVAPLYDQGEDWVIGGHAGYQHQFGNFVVGVEAEAMRLDITYEGFTFITVENSYAAKARGGYAIDRFLVSGHLGGVYATTNFMGLKDWGWTAGAGLDYALTDQITLGGQYTHYRFKEFDGTQIDADIDLVTARVGFKF